MNSKSELTIGAIPADNIAATEEDRKEQRNFRADELLEERKKVNQQQMKTPGRKGETIKQEEIDKEMVRRRSTR